MVKWDIQFATHFSTSSDMFRCSALARAMAPEEDIWLSLRLRGEKKALILMRSLTVAEIHFQEFYEATNNNCRKLCKSNTTWKVWIFMMLLFCISVSSEHGSDTIANAHSRNICSSNNSTVFTPTSGVDELQKEKCWDNPLYCCEFTIGHYPFSQFIWVSGFGQLTMAKANSLQMVTYIPSRLFRVFTYTYFWWRQQLAYLMWRLQEPNIIMQNIEKKLTWVCVI